MEKNNFKLIVKPGTEIISSKGNYIVQDVPDNALEHIENGATWLVLTSEAHDELQKLPAEKLQKMLHLRQQQGFDGDVKILEKALKSKSVERHEQSKKTK